MTQPIGLVAPTTEDAACPLCGGTQRTPIHRVADAVWNRPGEFGLVRCASCAGAFLSPRPPRESIGFYYRDLYRGEGLELEEKLQHSAIARFLNSRRFADLASRHPLASGERHLDVGCGVGAFLLHVSRVTGATGVGVDFDTHAVASATSRAAGHPVEVHAGTLAEQSFEPASFATVSMIHFLEHSYDPLGELRRAHALLAPGGAIVVEVPSDDSLARRVYGRYWFPHLAPQHLTLFSRRTLAKALADAGFTDVRVKDAFAPLVWTSSFVLAWHHNLGGRSRWAKNFFARLFTLLFAIAFFVPIVIADVVLAALLPFLGRGDHIRATAVRSRSR